uniref:hypothetical protein n=1 Tax=Emticicia sp. TaxID=1930953 RepID=UPI003BA4DAF8
MKKTFLSLALFIIILISCKYSDETQPKEQINEHQLIVLKSEKDVDTQKSIYTKLNSHEKHFIWQ